MHDGKANLAVNQAQQLADAPEDLDDPIRKAFNDARPVDHYGNTDCTDEARPMTRRQGHLQSSHQS